jgi:hypoxanthine phosphoribosyltransferase
MQSYDYAHRDGVYNISWDGFHSLARQLAEGLATYEPEAIVGVARAGLFPATAIACMLRRELYPTRLTRRLNDEVIHDTPVWITPVPPEVTGKIVAVVDDIADSGETLSMVAEAVSEAGARKVVTACLVSHSWADPPPDLTPMVSDALVLFPWDQRVYMDGKWQPHPEIVTALEVQANKEKRTERKDTAPSSLN